jgi:hypothetical protein
MMDCNHFRSFSRSVAVFLLRWVVKSFAVGTPATALQYDKANANTYTAATAGGAPAAAEMAAAAVWA